jgi:hypothetical protein
MMEEEQKEHCITLYNSNEKTQKLINIRRIYFTLWPVEVKRITVETDGIIAQENKFPKKKYKRILLDWLFKKRPIPEIFPANFNGAWDCTHFDEEDKKLIRKLYVLEDL